MERERPENLFFLIKNLHEHEYRRVIEYARIFNAQESQVHIRMFKYLRNTENFNYDKLKAEFQAHPVKRVKNYLHNFIFKALRVAGLQSNHEVEELIGEIDICLRKHNFVLAKKKINAALFIAKSRELFTQCLQILELERTWIYEHVSDSHQLDLLERNWADSCPNEQTQQSKFIRRVSGEVCR